MAGCGVGPLLHHRQLRHAQRQPLGAVAGEVDLDTGIVARAFNGQHLAFAKLGVEHGKVLAIAGTGDDARAKVNFPRHGTKWLALSVAKLTVVD